MTDDGKAEKNALLKTWPEAIQLLCHFHVAQAEWRWLLDTKNSISSNRRQELMKIFRKVIYNTDTVVTIYLYLILEPSLLYLHILRQPLGMS